MKDEDRSPPSMENGIFVAETSKLYSESIHCTRVHFSLRVHFATKVYLMLKRECTLYQKYNLHQNGTLH